MKYSIAILIALMADPTCQAIKVFLEDENSTLVVDSLPKKNDPKVGNGQEKKDLKEDDEKVLEQLD